MRKKIKMTTTVNEDAENPTQYLLDSLRESEADYKAGRYKSFETGQDALNYLKTPTKQAKKCKCIQLSTGIILHNHACPFRIVIGKRWKQGKHE